LPGSFVDRAAWPITLDPLFGAVKTFEGAASDDSQADVSYDFLSDSSLVVWKETLSASSVKIRGGLGSFAGTAFPYHLFFSSSGVADRPRVANVAPSGRFVVTWKQTLTTSEQICAQVCDPSTGILSSLLVPAAGTPGTFSRSDVGGEAGSSSFKRFIVVWDQNGTGIRGAKYDVSAAGGPVFKGVFTIAPDVTGVQTHDAPAISRTAGGVGLYAVAYLRKIGLLSGIWQSTAVVIDREGNIVNPPVDLTSVTVDELAPEVDGGGVADAQWVVVSVASNGSGVGVLHATPIRVGSPSLVVGATVPISSKAKSAGVGVAFHYGKVYVVWEEGGVFADSLKIVGLDPATCMTCESSISIVPALPAGTPNPSMCMNSASSGVLDTIGIVVWNQDSPGAPTDQDVLSQTVVAYAANGTATNHGGGCGQAGTLFVTDFPAIGKTDFSIYLSGSDPLAPLAILNVNAPVATLGCGPCQMLPYLLTFARPVVAGSASQALPIPCDTSFLGAKVEAQWTVVTPSSSPCALFPQFSLSDRWRLSIGG
jgi:hypothetical protein